MTESLKHYLYVVFSKLSFDERREMLLRACSVKAVYGMNPYSWTHI